MGRLVKRQSSSLVIPWNNSYPCCSCYTHSEHFSYIPGWYTQPSLQPSTLPNVFSKPRRHRRAITQILFQVAPELVSQRALCDVQRPRLVTDQRIVRHLKPHPCIGDKMWAEWSFPRRPDTLGHSNTSTSTSSRPSNRHGWKMVPSILTKPRLLRAAHAHPPIHHEPQSVLRFLLGSRLERRSVYPCHVWIPLITRTLESSPSRASYLWMLGEMPGACTVSCGLEA